MEDIPLNTFDLKTCCWKAAKADMEMVFMANGLISPRDDHIKLCLFLQSLTQESYDFLQILTYPKAAQEFTYNEMTDMLDKYYTPKDVYSARAKFYHATKQPNETCEKWALRLRELSETCDFGSGACLSAILLDKFIIGMEEGPVKAALVREDHKTLTMFRALRIAQAVEASMHSDPDPGNNISQM